MVTDDITNSLYYKLLVLQFISILDIMQQLIGRDRELADLDGAWQRAQSGVPQLAVIWDGAGSARPSC